MTNAKGALRQTIFYPYSFALQFARGNVLSLLVESPAYDVSELGHVPYLDAAGTMNPQDGKVSVFVLNRDLNKARTIEINWQDKSPSQVLTSTTLTGNDLKAFNSFDTPKKVAPQNLDKPSTSSGRTKFEVPPRSYTVIQWAG
jgi:alpha-N-arabinofuranosidase